MRPRRLLSDILALIRLELTPVRISRRYPWESWEHLLDGCAAWDRLLDRRWIADADARLDRERREG